MYIIELNVRGKTVTILEQTKAIGISNGMVS